MDIIDEVNGRDTRWLKRLSQDYLDKHTFDLTETGAIIPEMLRIRQEQIKNKKAVGR